MRLHRFFVKEPLQADGKPIADDLIIDTESLIHQWRNVFKLNTGSFVVLFDGSGFEAYCQIVSLTYLKAELQILELKKNKNVPAIEICLFQSLIKKDNFEWVLEKGTELGVTHFVPIISERSEKKDFNITRGKKIITEAAEQSGRAIVPTLHEVMKLSDVAKKSQLPSFAFHPETERRFDYLKEKRVLSGEKAGLYIGPEGGFTEREIELFNETNIEVVALGAQILRAETAAVAVSALLLL